MSRPHWKLKARDVFLQGDGDDEDDADESDAESDGDSSCDEDTLEDPPPQRLAMVVMMCMIGGYTLIGPLQHDLKHALHISDKAGETFTLSVAMVQWGKTFMTVGQNFVLGHFTPRERVYVSMIVMFLGVLIPPLFVYTLGIHFVGLVAVSYTAIGLALGSFEGTFLSVITPLGPLTKSWAIMGFPAAFGIVNIIGRSSMVLFGLPVEVLFWSIVCGIPVAMYIFKAIAPRDTKTAEGKSYTQAGVRVALRDWRTWFLQMVPFMLVNIVSHFVMESVFPAIFNTYNAHKVSLYGPNDLDNVWDKNWFLVVLSVFNMAGDMIGRRVGYCFDLKNYTSYFMVLIFALLCSISGLYLSLLGVAIVCWPAIFLAFSGAGFNYAVASKYIDKHVPRRHNLAAYSLWMFVGYAGAIMGAMLVDVVTSSICNKETYLYQCKDDQ